MDSWRFKMGPTGCPETSLRNYHNSLRNNPEDRSPNLKAKIWGSHSDVDEDRRPLVYNVA